MFLTRLSIVAAALGVVVTAAGCARGGGGDDGRRPELKTDDQKTLYALGLLMGRNVATFNLTKDELAIVKAGLADAVSGQKPEVDITQYQMKVSELARARQGAAAEAEKAKSKPFIEAALKEKGAVKTDSGMVYIPLKEGTGESPQPTDIVKVNYHGTLTNGEVFDSSVQRGQPAEFPLNRVVPCWTEGMQKMKIGGKARLICPSAIAYGDMGRPPKIPGGATLVFEVELLEVKKGSEQLSMPMPPGGPGQGLPGHPPLPPGMRPLPGGRPPMPLPPMGGKPGAVPPPPSVTPAPPPKSK
jgi:FKBP-type peptidyl-prolyl cis-trans isomerase FkpA